MDKSEFQKYHEDEVLAIPTNRINTTPGSQAERLLKVFNKFIYDDIQDAEKIKTLTDLDNDVGGQLDDVGDDLDIPRLGRSDELYRFLLKLKMANRTSQGTFNELIQIVAHTFDISPSDVQVKNDYKISDDGSAEGTPFSVSVQNLPLDNIEHPEIVKTFIDAIQNALALGITLSNVTFVTYPKASVYLATSMKVFELVEIKSDVDSGMLDREIENEHEIRSTQAVTTLYKLESEEVDHG